MERAPSSLRARAPSRPIQADRRPPREGHAPRSRPCPSLLGCDRGSAEPTRDELQKPRGAPQGAWPERGWGRAPAPSPQNALLDRVAWRVPRQIRGDRAWALRWRRALHIAERALLQGRPRRSYARSERIDRDRWAWLYRSLPPRGARESLSEIR